MTSRTTAPLSESLEDYLEAILDLEGDDRAARAADIAARLGVSRPSVTGALRLLADRGLVHYVPYGPVSLTSHGRRTASAVARRHRILKDFLEIVLALPGDDAERAACRMEHVLEPRVMTRFLEFARFVDACPHHATRWVRGVGFTCRQQMAVAECARCPGAAPPASSSGGR